MPRICIVGGGIGGLVLGMALHKCKKYDVIVYEKYELKTDAGSGMSLIGNSLFMLQSLGVDVKKVSKMINNIQLITHDDHLLFQVPTDIDPDCVAEFGSVQVNVHRGELHAELLSKYKGEIVFGKQFTNYCKLPNGKIRLQFDDGSEDTCDLLVGADGVYSQVRTCLLQNNLVDYSGFVSFRGILDSYTDDISDHLRMVKTVTYKQDNNSYVYGFISKNRIFWAFDIELDQGTKIDNKQVKAFLKERMKYMNPMFYKIVEQTDKIIQTDICDKTPTFRKYEDGIVLIGDACHPVVHHFGQGACMAIEDAIRLTKCLNETSDINKALRLYISYQWRNSLIVYISRIAGWMFVYNNWFINSALYIALAFPFNMIIVTMMKFLLFNTNRDLKHYMRQF